MAAKDDVLKTIGQFTRVLMRKDAQALVGFYADDIVGFELAPPLVSSADVLREPKNVQKWFDTWDGNLEVGTRDQVVHIDGDLAHVSQLMSLSGKQKEQGPVSIWIRSSMLLKKQRSGWKLVHFHESVPFAMDGSKRALADLQP